MRFLFGCVWLGFCVALCQAKTALPLYQVTVPIQQQSPQALAKALPGALTQVLIKVSGRSNVVDFPGIKSTLIHAKDYVQRYQYQQQQVTVIFVAEAINGLLKRSQLPIWRAPRPQVLILMGIDKRGLQSVLAAQTAEGQALYQVCQQRGLDCVLPIMDLQDISQLSYATLSQFSPAALSPVMQRYAPNAVIIATLEQKSTGQWLGRWQLDFKQKAFNTTSQATTPHDAMQQAVDVITDHLAAQLTTVNSYAQASSVTLTIMGVNSAARFAWLENYLKQLSVINAVYVQSVSAGQVDYVLQLGSDVRALKEALRLDHKLQRVDPDAPSLIYQVRS